MNLFATRSLVVGHLILGVQLLCGITACDSSDASARSSSSSGSGGSGGETPSADCPTDDFIEVTSANDNLDDPEYTVSCTSTDLVVKTNAIPNFPYIATSPGDPAAQDLTYTIPLKPVASDDPEDVPLLGPLGVSVSGIPLFGPTEANGGDAVLAGLMSDCGGHNGPSGYHFHQFSYVDGVQCMFDYDEVNGNTSLVIGYALDGYKILAPFVCEGADCATVKEVQSSWQLKDGADAVNSSTWDAHEYVDGLGDLDECNGLTGADGVYRYYATSTFPYFLGCYHGTASGTVTGITGPGPRM